MLTSPDSGDGSGSPLDLLKKRGLFGALLGTPPEEYDSLDPASAGAAPPVNDGGTAAPAPSENRINDDLTKHPQGDAPQLSLAEKMNAGDYGDLEFGEQDTPEDAHLAKLQSEYDQGNQPRPPMKLWQKIALAASTPFGGLTSYVQERDRQDQMRDTRQGKLLDQIEAERRTQETERGANRRLQTTEDLANQRMTLTEKLAQEREQAAADRQAPEHIDTDQGPIQYDRGTKQWGPITVGGKNVGPKPTKPDPLDQQYDDAITRGDKVRAAQIKQEKADLAAAGQAPQRDPQQLAIAPDGTVIALKPGAKVPQGTRTVAADLNAAQLTPATQTILQTTEPVKHQVQQLLERLEQPDESGNALKDDNTPGTLAYSRLKYAVGIASPEGSLGEDISKIEMDRVIAGARILKGSSRAYQALELAMKHAPNTWRDSPKLMYQKLTSILQNLTDVEEDAKKFGIKGQTLGDANQKSGGSGTLKQKQALTVDEARQYLQRAGGDKNKARALAKSEGRTF